METILFGVFNGNIWRDEMNGKSFFRLITKHRLVLPEMYQNEYVIKNPLTGENEKYYEVKCSAFDHPIPSVERGTPVKVTGYFASDQESEGSWNFMVSAFIVESNDAYTSVRFLNSQGIGKYAEELVAKFGVNIFSYPDIPEVGELLKEEEKGEAILQKLQRKYMECLVFDEMSTVQIPYPYSIKLVKQYGAESLKMLKADPYNGLKVGLTFRQCDRLAIRYGLSATSYSRIRAVADVCMDQIKASGNTYELLPAFQQQVMYRLQHGEYKEEIPTNVPISFKGRSYEIVNVAGKSRVVNRNLRMAEERVAKNLKRLLRSDREPYNDRFIPMIEEQCHMAFGKEQREAFQMFHTRGIKILTGGPGTGKTTTVKGLLLYYQMMHPNHVIRLAAPTGRAAQRLAESTDMPATTIHKLLEYIPYGESPMVRDANNPIEADLLVIDEVSMLDIEVCDMLLEAVKTGTMILLVGDVHQLESVGPGAILRDLLKSRKNIVEKTMLTEVYRQKGGSPIIDNSIKINDGNTELAFCDDFQFIRCDSQEDIFEAVKQLYPKFTREGMFDTQILCPSYKGEAGIDRLNVAIRDMVNPEGKTLVYGFHKYRVGDKVIMTRNNAEVGYYNGDIGVIDKILEDEIVIKIRKFSIHLDRECFDDLRLAYAISIHRSQGSEFKNVIIVLPKEPKSMLVRNLFYTAVTRAKKRVVVISEQEALETAIQTSRTDFRKTGLTALLDKIG